MPTVVVTPRGNYVQPGDYGNNEDLMPENAWIPIQEANNLQARYGARAVNNGRRRSVPFVGAVLAVGAFPSLLSFAATANGIAEAVGNVTYPYIKPYVQANVLKSAVRQSAVPSVLGAVSKTSQNIADTGNKKQREFWNGVADAAETASAAYGVAHGGFGILRNYTGAGLAGKIPYSLVMRYGNRAQGFVDWPQVAFTLAGSTADLAQQPFVDNKFDDYENKAEIAANIAGMIGGTNIATVIPVAGPTIDKALDAAAYGQAAWDLVKKTDGVKYELDKIRRDTKIDKEK